MSNPVNEDIEFQSPTKSIYNIFKRSSFDSYDSNESGTNTNRRSLSPIRKSISNSLTGTTTPSSKRISKSPSKFRTIMPIFSNRNSTHSRPEITNPFIEKIDKEGSKSASIKDFADTSSEEGSVNDGQYSEYDSESVESILQEYTDEKKKLFRFQEHFDDKSIISNKRKSVKSILERTLYSDGSDSKRSSAGSDFQIYKDTDGKSKRSSSRMASREILQAHPSTGNLTMSSNNEFYDAKSAVATTDDDIKTTESNNTVPNDQTRSFNADKSMNTTKSGNINDTNPVDLTEHKNTNTTGDYTSMSLHKTTEESKDTNYSSISKSKEGLQIHGASDTSEQALYQDLSYKLSNISLNSGELLTKLERSLSNWSEESNEAREVAYKPEGPKLVTIDPYHLEQVHYHDSDISSNNSIGSIRLEKLKNHVPLAVKLSKSTKFNRYDNSRRPPPIAPGIDSLTKPHQHEKMMGTSPKSLILGFPRVTSPISSNVTSPIYSDYDSDSYDTSDVFEKGYEQTFKPNHYSWEYFFLFMVLGLLLPPIFFFYLLAPLIK